MMRLNTFDAQHHYQNLKYWHPIRVRERGCLNQNIGGQSLVILIYYLHR